MNSFCKCFLVILGLTAGLRATAQSFRDSRTMPPPAYRNNNGYNQNRGVNKIIAAKETYLNMQLQLTEEEADRFWPLYRQYEQELSNVRRLKRINNSNAQQNGNDQINNELYYEQRLVEIHKHYTDEFLKILPPQKVSLIYKSERQFSDELIRQMGERRGNRAGPNARPYAPPGRRY